MKTLFLIRHAKSSWADIGARDIDRVLNDRGHKDAPEMAKFLHNKGISPDLIVSSPAKRAVMTAGYFANELGIPLENIDIQTDIYEADEATLRHIVRGLPDVANTILLFGHNPTFTYFANRYTKDYIDNIATCGIVQYNLNAQHWADFNEITVKVEGYFYPKMPSY
jgi:phosphohistidine phosphatase